MLGPRALRREESLADFIDKNTHPHQKNICGVLLPPAASAGGAPIKILKEYIHSSCIRPKRAKGKA